MIASDDDRIKSVSRSSLAVATEHATVEQSLDADGRMARTHGRQNRHRSSNARSVEFQDIRNFKTCDRSAMAASCWHSTFHACISSCTFERASDNAFLDANRTIDDRSLHNLTIISDAKLTNTFDDARSRNRFVTNLQTQIFRVRRASSIGTESAYRDYC
jgi:hypothetical protein